MDPITFQLSDRDGNSHEYRVDPHPAREGSDFAFALVGTLAEPIIEAVRIAALSAEKDAEASGGMLDFEIGDLLEDADLSALGPALRTSIRGLDSDLVFRFFKYTERDGEKLSVESNYDLAYQANWGEWARALWKIIQANGFLDFLPSTPSS